MGRKTAILVRRGREIDLRNAKLMEGELAYTTDKKELFIGSGNGNIKIGNTENDNYMKKRIYDPKGNGVVTKKPITWDQLKGVW